jgi:hypothetical protein
LQAHSIDAKAVFRRAGLNPEHLGDPDARYLISGIQKLWSLGVETHERPLLRSGNALDWAYAEGLAGLKAI